MPMSDARANAISDAVVAGQTYPEIAQRFYPTAEYPSQTVYNCISQPTVSALIAEKSKKLYNTTELQALTVNTIDKVTTFIESNELTLENAPELVKVIDKQKDFIELQGRFQGAFIDKSMIINIDTTLDEINERANLLLDHSQQGRS